MKVHRKTPSETLLSLPTTANRSLGIFLVFLGLVGALPTWYLIRAWTSVVPNSRPDWYPGLAAAVVISLVGFLLATRSRKHMCITAREITVWDGLFRRPLHYRWDGTPVIRLQNVERGEGPRRRVIWLVKLVSEHFEYTLDERVDQQLESRTLAEVTAKTLPCPLRERTDEGTDVVIDPHDLDMPFRERVARYPALLGKPAPRPSGVPYSTRIVEKGAAMSIHWSLIGQGFILDILALGAVFFVLSTIPERQHQPSLWDTARATGDYHLYLWVAVVILLVLLLTVGLSVNLYLGPASVRLRILLFGVPLKSRTLRNDLIEDVRLLFSVRGPTVQIVADHQILEFPVSDTDLAGWLAFEIRCFLINREEAICRCRSMLAEEATIGPGTPS